MSTNDHTRRFSNRADHYVKGRPGYAPTLYDFLAAELGLTPASVIADIGSGTGLLTRVFLERGNEVYGVEPNPEMRAAGETFLADFPTFHSLNAAAEATSLPNQSIDFVTVGAAFHWFEMPKFQVECLRILKPSGWAVIVRNRRRRETPFVHDYEVFDHNWNAEVPEARRRYDIDDRLTTFFGSHENRSPLFENPQRLGWESFKGRVLSMSNMPSASDPRLEAMLADLRVLFDKYQADGILVIEQDTEAVYGRVAR